jgi:rRNA maturation endonuclease Nob1
MIPIEKTFMGRRFNPDKYGMIYCPVCHGAGKLFNGSEGEVVCRVCGGFGLVKKHISSAEEKRGIGFEAK